MTDIVSEAAGAARGGTPPLPYYTDAAIWENDIARRNRRSRSIAWTIALVMSVIAVAALGALVLALPLKTYEPYMVVVDRSTGFVC